MHIVGVKQGSLDFK